MASDTDSAPEADPSEHLSPDDISAVAPAAEQPERVGEESITQPGKVMRVGSMIKQLLDEVRQSDLDDASRARLQQIYQLAVAEVGEALSPDLQEELGRFSLPFLDEEGVPSDAELRVAQAQLVGWLEGLFTGIQATLFAQQMAARQQLEQMRGQLPPGAPGAPGGPGGPDGPDGPDGQSGNPGERPGTYL